MGFEINKSIQYFESDLQFDFLSADWQLKKYDTHRYFKILSGAGLSGVDFLGIHKGQQVVFFEVKNYHTNLSNTSPKYSIFENRTLVINRIADKVKDSAQAIRIIIQYLNRKWWYRLFIKLDKLLPYKFFKSQDWYFWHQVNQLIQIGETPLFVLWLEIDYFEADGISKVALKKLLRTELSESLTDLVTVGKIADMEQPVFKTSLRVNRNGKEIDD